MVEQEEPYQRIHAQGALEALLRCNQMIEAGELPRAVSGDLDFLIEELVNAISVAFKAGRYWTASATEDADAERARWQIYAVRRILNAGDYKIPIDKLRETSLLNYLDWPETHGLKILEILQSIRDALEIEDDGQITKRYQEGGGWWNQRASIRKEVPPFAVGLKEQLEAVWKHGKVNTPQSLACSIYRSECEELGLPCPNNDNLKKYFQKVVRSRKRPAGYFERFSLAAKKKRDSTTVD